MPFTQEMNEGCEAPLKAEHIKTRQQGGQTLSYIEGHQVIREANAIFGFDGWTREVLSCDLVQAEQKPTEQGRARWYVGYTARVRLTVHGVSRDGMGFGSGIDSDLGRAHESAVKEAETDAFKRAAMTFGDRFGLALYDKQKRHVEQPGPGNRPTNGAEPKKYPGAGEFLKSIGLNADQATKFKEGCKAKGVEWGEIALAAKASRVESFLEFQSFTGNRFGSLAELMEEIAGAKV